MSGPVVGVPRDRVVVLTGRGQVSPPIAVQIGRHDGPSTDGIVVDDLLDLAEGTVHADILENGDRIIARRCGGNVGIAVVIEIGDGNALPFVDGRRDQVLGKHAGAIILEPPEAGVVIRRPDNVLVAVAVAPRAPLPR